VPRPTTGLLTAILVKTAAAFLGCVLVLLTAWWGLHVGGGYPLGSSLAAALAGVQTVAVVGLCSTAAWRRFAEQRREARDRALAPGLLQLLADHAAATDRLDRLRWALGKWPALVETSLMAVSLRVKDTGRSRLADLAEACGLRQRWEAALRASDAATRLRAMQGLGLLFPTANLSMLGRALHDPDQRVGLAAARGLIKSGHPRELERLFAHALDAPLLVRALLGAELARHVGTLTSRAAPHALRSTSPQHVEATLDLLASWRRSMDLPDAVALLASPHAGVRRAVLRLVPYLMRRPADAAIVAALDDADPDVQAAAGDAIGRLGIASGLPTLVVHLGHESDAVARSCAASLARLQPGGAALEQAIVTQGGRTGSMALEALERVRLGRRG